MLCLNNVRKSPAKLPSVTEGQVRHFLVNLSDLIPFVLSSSLRILAQLFWTLTASESAGGGESPPKEGTCRSCTMKGQHWWIGKGLGTWGYLAADLGPWQASLVGLACCRSGQVILNPLHPAPSSYAQGQCEGHMFLFWIISVFRLPKSKLTGDTVTNWNQIPILMWKAEGFHLAVCGGWLNLQRSQG